jgi:anti-anti-sigma regulatory factor
VVEAGVPAPGSAACAAPRREIDAAGPAGDGGLRSGIELTVRNREAGQVVEVAAHGCLSATDVPSLKARVDRLIVAREPRELWIDLRDATGDINLAGSLVDVSDALWSIGGKLVVRHPSAELRQHLVAAADRMVIEAERT